MKRYGNLWGRITAFENLLQASRQAQKGKRYRPSVLEFNYHLEEELHTLQAELLNKTYQPGAYRTFRIYDPKPRLISAAPYRDRVIHHALCNIIVPLLDSTFIAHSYANRAGYGTHRALQKLVSYMQSSAYVLQCDIQKYFPSIDHTILKQEIRRKIKCKDTLWLVETIIDGSNPQEPVTDYFPGDALLTPLQRRKGLPIGNLTSQFFANVYLNRFDHFVQETLNCPRYLRYVDDFCLFSDNREQLARYRPQLEAYLGEKLRLRMHPVKSQLFETQYGVNFVGFRILPTRSKVPRSLRIRVRNDNLRRSRRRFRQLQAQYALGHLSLAQLSQRLRSWEAHLFHGNTYGLRRALFASWSFQRQTHPQLPTQP